MEERAKNCFQEAATPLLCLSVCARLFNWGVVNMARIFLTVTSITQTTRFNRWLSPLSLSLARTYSLKKKLRDEYVEGNGEKSCNCNDESADMTTRCGAVDAWCTYRRVLVFANAARTTERMTRKEIAKINRISRVRICVIFRLHIVAIHVTFVATSPQIVVILQE